LISVIESNDVKVDDIESNDVKVDDIESTNTTEEDESKNLFDNFNKLSELESLD